MDTAFVIVVIIAVLNIIAYINVQEWSSLGFFVAAGGVSALVLEDNTLALVVAIVGTSLFRAIRGMRREGLENRVKKAPKKEGLLDESTTSSIDTLFSNQKELMSLAEQLEPMMAKVESMVKGLPPGFLNKAVDRLKK